MRTDPSTPSRFRRIRAEVAQVILGPWPIRPVLIGFISFAVFQYSSGAAAVAQNDLLVPAAYGLPVNIARGIAVGVVLAVLLRVYRRITGRSELTRAGYLVIIFITGISAAMTRYVTMVDTGERVPEQLFFGLVRGVVTFMILTSALGIADARLLKQIRQTDAALEIVRTQRSAVLEAEERARQSIATILHDRVQAGLVAATLQLKQLTNALRGEEAARLESVIADLEAIRTQDVRSASRQLSPDLRNVTLTQALKVLASNYEPAMQTTIDVGAVEAEAHRRASGDPLSLGTYRIVEQALLNAAAHGGATQVSVMAHQDDDDLVMVIHDNGRGLGQEPVTPGAGFAIIDAWTAAIDGTWTVEEAPTGTDVTVRLPREA